MKEFKVIGVMSGSSLDGIDLAYCRFWGNSLHPDFEIVVAETLPYDAGWQTDLQNIRLKSPEELFRLHAEYGFLLGSFINNFIKKFDLKPDLIASHGHTVFHNPGKHFTFQLGSGQAIAVTTGIVTIADFRTKDVLLGGEGAPLVPVGDAMLFDQYDYCLNIGGIANISMDEEGIRKGRDLCPANQLLNHLSRQMGEPYDENGRFAALGKLHKPLFDRLNEVDFYHRNRASLNNETVESSFIPLIDSFDIPVQDKLYTVVKHIAYRVNLALKQDKNIRILVTGGGAHNRFLLKALELEKGHRFILPSKDIIDYKEALIFALLGMLRYQNKINCLSSVTGAKSDCSTGNILLP